MTKIKYPSLFENSLSNTFNKYEFKVKTIDDNEGFISFTKSYSENFIYLFSIRFLIIDKTYFKPDPYLILHVNEFSEIFRKSHLFSEKYPVDLDYVLGNSIILFGLKENSDGYQNETIFNQVKFNISDEKLFNNYISELFDMNCKKFIDETNDISKIDNLLNNYHIINNKFIKERRTYINFWPQGITTAIVAAYLNKNPEFEFLKKIYSEYFEERIKGRDEYIIFHEILEYIANNPI